MMDLGYREYVYGTSWWTMESQGYATYHDGQSFSLAWYQLLTEDVGCSVVGWRYAGDISEQEQYSVLRARSHVSCPSPIVRN